MGTRFELILDEEAPAARRGVADDVWAEVRRVEALFSRFQKQSWLAHLQRQAPAWVRADADALDVFSLCQEIHTASAGAFDLSVGARMSRTGFHVDACAAGRAGAAVPQVAMGIEVDRVRARVRLLDPTRSLDLGAVGKGAALDRAAECLLEAGVETALLHAGTSSIRALGAPPGATGWKVAVRGLRGALGSCSLRDMALSVSSTEGQVLTGDGGRRTHVVDPLAEDAAWSPACVAVVSRSAARADASSTALLVQAAYRDAGSMPLLGGLEAVVVEIDTGAGILTTLSPGGDTWFTLPARTAAESS